MKKLFSLLLLLSISFSNTSAQNKTYHRKTSRSRTYSKKNIKYGTASFYARKFNGRKTASGDRYNSTQYTAACNVFPMNTWIRVTNLKNNKSVIVIINDRLRSKSKRLVDLSKDAAKKLGYAGTGLAHVRVEVLRGYKP
jgi:rare lipoprotein A